MKTVTLRLVCVVRIFFFFFTAENSKARCTAGSVAGGHILHVLGISVVGLCARFVPTMKWHQIIL